MKKKNIMFVIILMTLLISMSPKAEELLPALTVQSDTITSSYQLVDSIPILMYHDFQPNSSNYLTVLYDDFIEQLEYLQNNNYTTITMNDLYLIRTGELLMPNNPIIICADDGYLSNYTFMYPELKKRDMCATVFVIGDHIDRATNGEYIDALGRFTWEQAREMNQDGTIDIQLHTYKAHTQIEIEDELVGIFATPLEPEIATDYKLRIDKDIKKNIEVIGKNLGYFPITFAYPYGQYSKISEEVLKENGIEFTFTTNTGFLQTSDDGYLSDRITVSGINSFEIFKKTLENS